MHCLINALSMPMQYETVLCYLSGTLFLLIYRSSAEIEESAGQQEIDAGEDP